MKFEVDINKILSNDINIYHYLFLQFVYNQDINNYNLYVKANGKFVVKEDLDYLMSIELLEFKESNDKYLLSNLIVTNKFIDNFMENEVGQKSSTSKVEDWIDEWYELWPKGIKSGSYPVRSGLKGCLTKMKKFLKENKNYTKDMVMKATKDYIQTSRMNNYKYMQIAHYYISKNNMSTLAANCELIENKGITEEVSYIDDI